MRHPSIALLVATTVGTLPAYAQAPQPVTAFVNVSVVPMDRERVLAGQTVVVRGSRIVALGSAKRVLVPAGVTEVDGRGKFLIPGLADMHTHARDSFAFLANGITTVRSPGGSPTGDPMLDLRKRVQAGQVLGPRIYTAGSVSWDSPPADAARSITEIKAAGYDAIKVPAGTEPDEVYDSILAAARRVNLKIVGHVPATRNLEEVLASGQWSSIEHLMGYFEYVVGLSGRWTIGDAAWLGFNHRRLIDTAAWMKPTFKAEPQLRKIAMATRASGVWNCPTLVTYDQLIQMASARASLPEGATMLRTTQRLFDLTLQVTKALQDNGAGLLLGTDEDPFAIHRELQLLVRAGLTPYQALATGTRNVATFLGTLDSTGTIAEGKRADLVLLNGNPLKDIWYTAGPAGVMVGGRWIPRAEIDATLDAAGLAGRRDEAWHRATDTRSSHGNR